MPPAVRTLCRVLPCLRRCAGRSYLMGGGSLALATHSARDNCSILKSGEQPAETQRTQEATGGNMEQSRRSHEPFSTIGLR